MLSVALSSGIGNPQLNLVREWKERLVAQARAQHRNPFVRGRTASSTKAMECFANARGQLERGAQGGGEPIRRMLEQSSNGSQ